MTFRSLPILSAALTLLALTAIGCTAETAASEACEDTMDAMTDASMRCGSTDRAAARKELVRLGAAGDCKNVKRIRNEVELRGTCFSWLEKAACDVMARGPVDESCMGQLIREQ